MDGFIKRNKGARTLNYRIKLRDFFDRFCNMARLWRAPENRASVTRVTEVDHECSISFLSLQQWPSEPTIIITSWQKAAGCRADSCPVRLKRSNGFLGYYTGLGCVMVVRHRLVCSV